MQVPPEIDYKGVEATPALDNLLQQQITKLERVSDHIVSLHISIEKEQGRHMEGNPYRVRLDIRIPPSHEIVVDRLSSLHGDAKQKSDIEPGEESEKHASQAGRKEEPLPAVVRRAFDSARRQVEKLVQVQRGEKKAHPQNEVTAFVERLFRDEGYGFLRSVAGEQIYFHKNASLHGEWGRLEVGTGVRYAAEQGDKGLQATSVEIVNKPGVNEMHSDMHELPVVAKLKKKR